jgi:flagellar basal-body rod protein FlgB
MDNDINVLNYLEAGIKAEGARQKTIANNVANVNSPGYRRSDIRFEELLTKAIAAKRDLDPSKLEPEFYQPKTTPIRANGNDVALDMEIGEMVKNSLRHKTYLLLLKKKYQQLTEAMRII